MATIHSFSILLMTALFSFLPLKEENSGQALFKSEAAFLLLSPSGAVSWMPGEALSFEWMALENYTGAYRLKILQLADGEPAPDELPDTGLFFDESGINGTSFSYPDSAPFFSPGGIYAWQVETDELVNGQIQKSQNVEVATFPQNCGLTLSGMPTNTLCPGDCFTLTAQFGSLALDHRVVWYADHENLSAITVQPSAAPPFPLSELNSAPLESPPHYAGFDNAVSFEICIDEGAAGPISFSAYYYQPGFSCTTNPMDNQCCHDVESFEVMVADIPDFSQLELELKDQIDGALVTEICSGEPILFSIQNLPTTDQASPIWQYNDGDGSGWQDIGEAPFTDFTFPVPAGHNALAIDCTDNEAGFVERIFRAKLVVDEAPAICEYFTTEYPLRICCPITNAALEMATTDDFNLSVGLCEGDVLSLGVALQPEDPFVSPPGEFVSIQWFLNETELPDYSGQASFILPGITAATEDICLKAVVRNCANKEKAFTRCINVDPMPVCDTIVLKAPVLEPVESEPGLVAYEACPNSAFTLEAVGFGPGTCVILWEYSYDQEEWLPLGSSNTIQNTNLIIEGDFTSIFYRAKCQPLNNPSGCEPCLSSNIIEIREIQPPSEPAFIDCYPLTWCPGDVVEPYITFVEEGVTYTWYVNGVALQESPFILEYTLQDNTCLQYTASNACYTVSSNLCCVKVCDITAVIGCPLAPNECACLGDPIVLTAENSGSSCEESLLAYEWTWTDASGVLQTANTSSITDTPPANGTTYTLTVNDLEVGCSDTATMTIIPCDKQ